MLTDKEKAEIEIEVSNFAPNSLLDAFHKAVSESAQAKSGKEYEYDVFREYTLKEELLKELSLSPNSVAIEEEGEEEEFPEEFVIIDNMREKALANGYTYPEFCSILEEKLMSLFPPKSVLGVYVEHNGFVGEIKIGDRLPFMDGNHTRMGTVEEIKIGRVGIFYEIGIIASLPVTSSISKRAKIHNFVGVEKDNFRVTRGERNQ